MREEVRVLAPVGQQLGLDVPATTLADERQGQDLAIRADGRRSRMPKERTNLLPDVIDHDIRPQAKVGKVGYHRAVLRWARRERELPTIVHRRTTKRTNLQLA